MSNRVLRVEIIKFCACSGLLPCGKFYLLLLVVPLVMETKLLEVKTVNPLVTARQQWVALGNVI